MTKKKKHKGRHRPSHDTVVLKDIKQRLHTECFTDDSADTEKFAVWRGPTTYLENK